MYRMAQCPASEVRLQIHRLALRRCDVIYSMLKSGTLYREQTLAA